MKKFTINFKFLPSKKVENIKSFNNSIYFMHIPKCGGTTIDQIFYNLSLVLNTFKFKRFSYQNKNNNKIQKFILPNTNEDLPCFISGHLDYNFSEKINNLYKFTIVRKPLERILSHYKFTLFKIKKESNQYSFEKFIEEEIDNNRDNLVTRHFAGLLNIEKKITDKDKDQAISNLRYFDNINIFENWDFFVSELLGRFGLPSVLYSNYQQIKYNFTYNFNEKDINLIYKNYEYDFFLYKEIYKKSSTKLIDKKNNYKKKICVVSPHLKTENKLFDEDQIKELFKKNIK